VYLAGFDLEVDAFEDFFAIDGNVEVMQLQHGDSR
jgi:hypothetical protein